MVTTKEVALEYKNTQLMLADLFTEPLEGQGYQRLLHDTMGGLDLKTIENKIAPKSTWVCWDPSVPRGSKRGSCISSVPSLSVTGRHLFMH